MTTRTTTQATGHMIIAATMAVYTVAIILAYVLATYAPQAIHLLVP